MDDVGHAFLKSILETPSPSGFEQPVQALVRQHAATFADELHTDRHGNVFAVRHPATRTDATPRIMLAGHCDQIGLMIQHIDAEGFLYIQPIGGWDMQILLGQYLTVWGAAGPITGVVARKAIHLLTPEERNKVPNFQDVWVDIGAKNKEEALALCRCGDPLTFALGYRPLRNDLAASPAMDDKVGLWVVMEALRQLHGRELAASVHSVSTVAEEIGLRGATTAAYAIHPQIGIAVDVCHATDTPGSDKKQVGEVPLGGGPVLFRGPNISPRVFDLLELTAQKHQIPYQVRGAPRATGTDANVMQISRDGVAVGIIGIPNRYMHSPVEVVHRQDLVHAAKLLAEFCASITPETNLIP
ncbi:MAG: M42 family metallopeptidase [Gemmataceae bacterium]